MQTKRLFESLISVFTILLGLSSCVQSFDYDIGDSQPQVVVNGILVPDSLFKVHVSLSKILSPDFDFEPVNDAHVLLYKNTHLVGQMEMSEPGVYIWNDYPQPGETYKIEVEISGYKKLSAQTTIPDKLTFSLLDYSYSGSTFFYNFELDMQDSQQSKPWVSIFSNDYKPLFDLNDRFGFPRPEPDPEPYWWLPYFDTAKIVTRLVGSLESTSPYLDDFNKRLAPFEGRYQYDYYVRVRPPSGASTVAIELATGYNRGISFGAYEGDERPGVYVSVFNADENFDRYMKAAVLNYTFGVIYAPNPFFTLQPTHSNIQNGLGLFASYTIENIKLDTPRNRRE
ncbi:MAG: DUF4249 family protein [Cyclobacteriaceae bacterium]